MSRESKYFELLSAYLDGELSSSAKEDLEEKIKSSLELQKKLEDLKKIKKLTSKAIKPIPPSPFFETRLFAAIDSKKSWYKQILKWSPAIGLAIASIILMVVLKSNPQMFKNLLEEHKSNLAGFYKENLKPLMFAADINNEDIFNFAMYKKLPLDKQNNQYVQLGHDNTGKEYFEIKKDNSNQSENNFEKFVLALELNDSQKKEIDSIIQQYAVELENQILVNDANTLALNSNLWNYQQAIQTDLLTFAERSNTKKFHEIVPNTASVSGSPLVVNNVHKVRTVKHKGYIVITPDSIFSENIDYDPMRTQLSTKETKAKLEKDKSRVSAEREKIRQFQFQVKYDSTWKKHDQNRSWSKNFKILTDTNWCKVEITDFDFPDMQFPDYDSLMRSIDSVAMNFKLYSKFIPKVEYFNNKLKIAIEGDSTDSYEFEYHNFDMDSLLDMKHELIDSLHKYNWKNYYNFSDSIVTKYIPKFDNYMKHYKSDSDFKEQMEELKKEMGRLKEEMREWKKELQEQLNSNKNNLD